MIQVVSNRSSERALKVCASGSEGAPSRLDLDRVMRETFALPGLAPGQGEVVEALLEHKRVLALFPRGDVGADCTALAVAVTGGLAVIVSDQLVRNWRGAAMYEAFGFHAARLDDPTQPDERRRVLDRLRSSRLRVLITTTQGFRDERVQAQLRAVPVALLALDDAHQLCERSHAYRTQFGLVAELSASLQPERLLALAPPTTPAVAAGLCEALAIAPDCVVRAGFGDLRMSVNFTATDAAHRDGLLVDRLRRNEQGKALVRVDTRAQAQRLLGVLEREGLGARMCHGGLDAQKQVEVREWWQGARRGILVSAGSVGAVADDLDATYVCHYGLPAAIDDFLADLGPLLSVDRGAAELFVTEDDAIARENAIRSDTPDEGSLRALVRAVSAAPVLEVSTYDLGWRCDMRLSAVALGLATLERMGLIARDGTRPQRYSVRPFGPPESVAARFEGERRRVVAELFAKAPLARFAYRVDVVPMSKRIGIEPDRVRSALEYLEERGLVRLRRLEPRVRLRWLRPAGECDAIVNALALRFREREALALANLEAVVEIASAGRCQLNAMLAHVGQPRVKPCGACSACRGERASREPRGLPPLPGPIAPGDVARLVAVNRRVLTDARRLAKFLCGTTSPVLERVKLSSHAQFGALREYRFEEVRAFCAPFVDCNPATGRRPAAAADAA